MSHDVVLNTIRRGEWRFVRGRFPDQENIVYDIGLTKDEIVSQSGRCPRDVDEELALLINQGKVIHRRSQKRYVAAGRYKNEPRSSRMVARVHFNISKF